MATIVVFVGSVRQGRQGRNVADWVASVLKARGHNVHLIDPAEHEELLVMQQMYKSMDDPSDDMQQLQEVISEADGYIAVTPEYNHSFSGAIKSALDHFLEEYRWKAFGIVTYSAGGFGGIRAAEPLRSVVAELGAPATPISLAVSKAQNVVGEGGELLDAAYGPRLERMLAEFEWYVQAFIAARAKGTPE